MGRPDLRQFSLTQSLQFIPRYLLSIYKHLFSQVKTNKLGNEPGRCYVPASFNELRNFFSLTSHKTFSDINSDPDVAASLEALYTHPDNVELYPGLMVEEAKPLITNASGLCAGETITKAILSDAVSLVRGDRFYVMVGIKE